MLIPIVYYFSRKMIFFYKPTNKDLLKEINVNLSCEFDSLT